MQEENKRKDEELLKNTDEKVSEGEGLPGPETDTWAAEAQDDLELWIEEQGIQLRY